MVYIPQICHVLHWTRMSNVAVAYEQQNFQSVQSANGVTLRLLVGDVVFLRQWATSKILDNEVHSTSLCGHLLFTM